MRAKLPKVTVWMENGELMHYGKPMGRIHDDGRVEVYDPNSILGKIMARAGGGTVDAADSKSAGQHP